MKALISVYDKTGLKSLLEALKNNGVEILATGGTFKFIKEAGYEVTQVSDYTGSKEILGGRVKTLHPKIHGGILARSDFYSDVEDLNESGIDLIDVVVCNLYPFEEKLQLDLTEPELVEFIDIGGPTMLRSAAKNFKYKIVLTDPKDYELYINSELDLDGRRKLAGKVFDLTSKYDRLIADYLLKQDSFFGYKKAADLRYGENPHQKGSFYTNGKGFMSDFTQLNGKELGYINYLDINSAYQLALEFKEITCVAFKHATPCGVASGTSAVDAYIKAKNADPISIFGGVVALNTEVDEECALEMKKIMLHIIIAPSFTDGALEVLKQKKNLIVIKMNSDVVENVTLRSLSGGLLVQDEDTVDFQELEVVTEKQPTKEQLEEMKFAYSVVKFTKSNAIVVTKDRATVGIGGGSVSRILAAEIAMNTDKEMEVLASDAFFPFDDVVELASKKGIKAIIQPGGSVRDQDSINKCNEKGISMVFTKTRHFRH